jgi:hypothetical protein
VTDRLINARVWDGSAWIGAKVPVGANLSESSVLEMCRNWPYTTNLDRAALGGTMTINSVALGKYDWVYKDGNQTVSSSDMGAWFSGSVDTHSAWVLVDGDLTINSGVLFTPPSRKLFTVVYVTGDATINGEISMSLRGANHSGTGISGGSTSAGDIRIATGTFSSVSNPQVPASGGAGGAAVVSTTNTNQNGNAGTAGTAGGTGGGGGGGAFGTTATSGAGGAGTSFCGGAGGGGCVTTLGVATTAGSGEANGGAGGNPGLSGNNLAGAGGGNPGGLNSAVNHPADTGIGGVLIVIVEGTLSGSGKLSADSPPNISGVFRTGGGAGGGSVTVMFGSDSSSITPTAAGAPQLSNFGAGAAFGGAGGAGTARKLAL